MREEVVEGPHALVYARGDEIDHVQSFVTLAAMSCDKALLQQTLEDHVKDAQAYARAIGGTLMLWRSRIDIGYGGDHQGREKFYGRCRIAFNVPHHLMQWPPTAKKEGEAAIDLDGDSPAISMNDSPETIPSRLIDCTPEKPAMTIQTCIKAVGHHVLVKPLSLEKQSKGGILLAHDERKEKAQIRGIVVSVGPNCWRDHGDGEPWATVGDEVFFAQYGGYLIRDPLTDEEFRMLNDEDVCAVVVKEAGNA